MICPFAQCLLSTQEPPNLLDNGSAPDLPARPTTTTVKTPPPATPQPSAAEINEQARMLKQYEEQQAALVAAREAEEQQRKALEVAGTEVGTLHAQRLQRLARTRPPEDLGVEVRMCEMTHPQCSHRQS